MAAQKEEEEDCSKWCFFSLYETRVFFFKV